LIRHIPERQEFIQASEGKAIFFNPSPTCHLILFGRKAVGPSTYSRCGFPKLKAAGIQRESLVACELEIGMGNIYFMTLIEPCTKERQLILWWCQVKPFWGFC